MNPGSLRKMCFWPLISPSFLQILHFAKTFCDPFSGFTFSTLRKKKITIFSRVHSTSKKLFSPFFWASRMASVQKRCFCCLFWSPLVISLLNPFAREVVFLFVTVLPSKHRISLFNYTDHRITCTKWLVSCIPPNVCYATHVSTAKCLHAPHREAVFKEKIAWINWILAP